MQPMAESREQSLCRLKIFNACFLVAREYCYNYSD